MSKKPFFLSNKTVSAAFLLSTLYWIYLFFTAKPAIIFDAAGYEVSGRILLNQGWIEYFKTGPQREPLYPLLIALAMLLGNWLSIPYLYIQVFFQILILASTQLLVVYFLKKLNISSVITALIVLYLGFSPALVNSAFSLFSEIGTYPFVLLIVLGATRAWQLLINNQGMAAPGHGLLLSLLFIALTCVKAIFAYIFMLFLVPFILLMIRAIMIKNYPNARLVLTFLLIAFIPFQAFMTCYKMLNKKYNGHYVFTDRMWLVYGNTQRRTDPMTFQRRLAAIASIPGEGVCRMAFSTEDCDYWTIVTADGMSHYKRVDLENKNIPETQWHREYVKDSLKKIQQHPFSYLSFYVIENLKTFFWESTQIGCVQYPAWLKRLFEWTIVKNGSRLFTSVITFFSFVFLVKIVWQGKTRLFVARDQSDERVQLCAFILFMIFAFGAFHSLVQLISRYIFSIAPLYLIAWALLLQSVWPKHRR